LFCYKSKRIPAKNATIILIDRENLANTEELELMENFFLRGALRTQCIPRKKPFAILFNEGDISSEDNHYVTYGISCVDNKIIIEKADSRTKEMAREKGTTVYDPQIKKIIEKIVNPE